jgi:beta-mannosidase
MRRASQLLQATGLGYAVEADRRRWPHCSMVLPWQLNESFPNAWCTSSIDYLGDVKPAFHAVTRAFVPTRASIQTQRAVFGGEAEMRAQAWVWAEGGVAGGSELTARLRAADGTVLGMRQWVLNAVDDPVLVGELVVPATGLAPDSVVVWELDWLAADGALLDHEVALATTGSDWSALLDLPPAELEVAVAGSNGERLVRIRHLSGPVVVGLQLVDERPAGAPGWAVIDGDPRPLLPGERRVFTVRGAPGPLKLESWNTEPLELA